MEDLLGRGGPARGWARGRYLEAGRTDEAIAEYERALKLFPGMALARFHLAQAYQKKGSTSAANTQLRLFREIWKNADPDLAQMAYATRSITANVKNPE